MVNNGIKISISLILLDKAVLLPPSYALCASEGEALFYNLNAVEGTILIGRYGSDEKEIENKYKTSVDFDRRKTLPKGNRIQTIIF